MVVALGRIFPKGYNSDDVGIVGFRGNSAHTGKESMTMTTNENTDREALDGLRGIAAREAGDLSGAGKRAVKRAQRQGRSVADDAFALAIGVGTAKGLALALEDATQAPDWNDQDALAAIFAALA